MVPFAMANTKVSGCWNVVRLRKNLLDTTDSDTRYFYLELESINMALRWTDRGCRYE